jgi:hypothetical protein
MAKLINFLARSPELSNVGQKFEFKEYSMSISSHGTIHFSKYFHNWHYASMFLSDTEHNIACPTPTLKVVDKNTFYIIIIHLYIHQHCLYPKPSPYAQCNQQQKFMSSLYVIMYRSTRKKRLQTMKTVRY